MISPSGKRPSGGVVAGVLVATVLLLALVAVYVWKKQSNATNILVNQHRDANGGEPGIEMYSRFAATQHQHQHQQRQQQQSASNAIVYAVPLDDDDFVAGGGTSGDIVYATPVLDDGYVPAQNGYRNNAGLQSASHYDGYMIEPPPPSQLQSASHYDGYAIEPPPPSGAGSSGSVYYDADPVLAEDIESNGFC